MLAALLAERARNDPRLLVEEMRARIASRKYKAPSAAQQVAAAKKVRGSKLLKAELGAFAQPGGLTPADIMLAARLAASKLTRIPAKQEALAARLAAAAAGVKGADQVKFVRVLAQPILSPIERKELKRIADAEAESDPELLELKRVSDAREASDADLRRAIATMEARTAADGLPPPGRADWRAMRDLEAMGRAEDYKRLHGRYPPTPSEVGADLAAYDDLERSLSPRADDVVPRRESKWGDDVASAVSDASFRTALAPEEPPPADELIRDIDDLLAMDDYDLNRPGPDRESIRASRAEGKRAAKVEKLRRVLAKKEQRENRKTIVEGAERRGKDRAKVKKRDARSLRAEAPELDEGDLAALLGEAEEPVEEVFDDPFAAPEEKAEEKPPAALLPAAVAIARIPLEDRTPAEAAAWNDLVGRAGQVTDEINARFGELGPGDAAERGDLMLASALLADAVNPPVGSGRGKRAKPKAKRAAPKKGAGRAKPKVKKAKAPAKRAVKAKSGALSAAQIKRALAK